MTGEVNLDGKTVTITSALPYVNGVKHLGNIVGSLLPADIFHRFLDLMDVDNIFICGTDEHGTQTEIAAIQEKLKPNEYADKYHKIQKEIYEKWNLSCPSEGKIFLPVPFAFNEFFQILFGSGQPICESFIRLINACSSFLQKLPDVFGRQVYRRNLPKMRKTGKRRPVRALQQTHGFKRADSAKMQAVQ